MKVNAVSIDETKYYTINNGDRRFIKEIRTVYIYDVEARVAVCEATLSYYLENLYTYIIYDNDPSEAIRDELHEKYCLEEGQDFYMHCYRVLKLPQRKECGEFETMEEAREHLQGNCPF